MTKRLSSSRTFIFLAGLVALASVRMTVAAAAVHPDGYVEIRDRLKDVIISGGENISSVEVQGALLRHPAVQDVGQRIETMRDDLRGDVVKLRDKGNRYRLRIGTFRVLFVLAGEVIQVYAVKDRKKAYD